MTKPEVGPVLEEALSLLEALEDWDTAEIEVALRGMLAELELSASKGLQPLRVAVSGSTVSPPLFESISVLGRERTIERLRQASAGL